MSMKPVVHANKFIITITVTFLISLILTSLFFVGFLGTWENRISDAFYSPGIPSDEIVIVEIDDASLQALDAEWPLPRTFYAKVIENVNKSRIIGIDIEFFTNKSYEEDIILADSIKKSGKIILAMKYENFSSRNNELYAMGLIKPISILGSPGEDFQIGFVNLYEESDGVIRYFTPHISGVEDHDHFSAVIVEQYLGFSRTFDNSKMLIKFYSKPGGYQRIKFSDVYFNTIDFDFTDKIVLIGVTTQDAHDFHTVPISTAAMPGVEIHANIIQSIILQDYLYPQDNITIIAVIFLISFLAGLLMYKFKIHIATIILILIGIVYVISAIYIFDYFKTIMNILYPLLSLVLVYVSLVVIYYRTEEKSRKWITSVFGKYVSPIVIDHLLENPDKIKLGGEKRNMTIFFSDIRGFTPISEQLKPEELVHLLNEYLTEMTSLIIKDQGLVDKYMGDAIMAFWGAPLDLPNHAEIACSTSLEMIDKLRELQKKWEQQGIPFFDIGIGINSGEAIVGNMGSSTRFDYTAIGDNVNLASRMEGLNKIYGTNIIITEKTYDIIKDKFETRRLDKVKVKGKENSILIYELVCSKNKLSIKQHDFIDAFEKGLQLYFENKWQESIQSFQNALVFQNDKATNIFITRCQGFLQKPPPKEWDGVWTMETK